MSPYVMAEVDYIIGTQLGVDAELAVLRELASGAYDLATFSTDDVNTAVDLVERYHDQNIGLADASLVVLARRHRTRSLLTLDHRHFGVVRPLDGGRFTLLPG